MDNIKPCTKNNNFTVRTGCRRPQSLEGNRQLMMLLLIKHDLSKLRRHGTHTHLLSPTTSLFGSAFLSHDKHVPCGAVQPTTNSRCHKNMFCLGGPLGRGAPARAPSAPWLIRHCWLCDTVTQSQTVCRTLAHWADY